MKITYAVDFPSEILSGVETLVEKYKHLLPVWVYQLEVEFDRTNQAYASINVDDPYRRCFLSIGPAWLDSDDKERLIIHEFAHVYNVPLLLEARNALECIYPDDCPAKDIANCGLTNAVERCTEDLVELILSLESPSKTLPPN